MQCQSTVIYLFQNPGMYSYIKGFWRFASNYIDKKVRKGGVYVAQSIDYQDFIDEVIAKNDIVDLISQHATLKRVGNR